MMDTIIQFVHIYFIISSISLLLSFTGNDQVEGPGCQVT